MDEVGGSEFAIVAGFNGRNKPQERPENPAFVLNAIQPDHNTVAYACLQPDHGAELTPIN